MLDLGNEPVPYGEKYGHATTIRTLGEARAYFGECVRHQMALGGYSREEAIQIERSNFNYWAGYFDVGRAEQIRDLFVRDKELPAWAL